YVIFAKGMTPGFGFAVSACIGVALLLAMMNSSVSGTVIPILFKKFGVDPAVASGPLITTVNDLVAVISYYGLTWIFLIEMLHLG
ncbi:MAG: magnesium transporter, partial [Anaerobutyricum sp.]